MRRVESTIPKVLPSHCLANKSNSQLVHSPLIYFAESKGIEPLPLRYHEVQAHFATLAVLSNLYQKQGLNLRPSLCNNDALPLSYSDIFEPQKGIEPLLKDLQSVT